MENKTKILLICPNCLRTHEVYKDDTRSLEQKFENNPIAQSCLRGNCVKIYGHDPDFGK